MERKNKIWKVRIKKEYPEATNHIAVGKIIDETPYYLKLECKTFHFKRPTLSAGIFTGAKKIRIFPWTMIAYASELPENFNWEEAKPFLTEHGDIKLKELKEEVGIKGGPHWVEN
jgi:hypothetical protein